MRIAIDIDDVLAAFTPAAHNFFGKELEKCDYWSVPEMDEKLGKGWFSEKISKEVDFWKEIPILSSPDDIDFEFDYYISSFPIERYDERVWWLIKNGFPSKYLLHSMDKVKTCKELGVNLLIDDKPKTVSDLRENGIRALHFITPYAGFEPIGEFITNLKQVKDYL